MKAYEVQQFGIENLALVERERPKPAAREVLVKFRAASLNYRDLMVAEGTYNPRMKMPAVPLSDGAGEVVALGEGATRWKAGDRVMPIFAQRWIDGDVTEEKRRTSLGAGSLLARFRVAEHSCDTSPHHVVRLARSAGRARTI